MLQKKAINIINHLTPIIMDNYKMLLAMHNVAVDFIRKNEELIPEGKNTLLAVANAISKGQTTDSYGFSPMAMTELHVDTCTVKYPTCSCIYMLRAYEMGTGCKTGLSIRKEGNNVQYSYSKTFDRLLKTAIY